MEKINEQNSKIINTLKGLAILLVVLGHSIQTVSNENFDNIYFRLIYCFHMPLFMFLSGFVTAYSPTNSLLKLKKRFYRLVLPFLAWTVVTFIYRSAEQGDFDFYYFLNLLKNVDNGLWFLWVLFLMHFFFYVSQLLRKYLGKYSFLAVALALQASVVSFLGFSMLRYYIVFFLVGYYFNNSKVLLFVHQWKYALFVVSSVAFLLMFPHWKMSGEVDVVAQYFGFAVSLFDRLYRMVVAFFAIVALFNLFTIYHPFEKVFNWIGLRSLEIYVTHQYFFGLTMLVISALSIVNPYFQTIFCTVSLLALALSLAWIIKRWTYTDKLFFGKY